MLNAGKILQKRYEIITLLAEGGMGRVYKAKDLRLNTFVAVKETILTEALLKRQFQREAQILAGLHHSALPRVIDYFEEESDLYLVMDFIPGKDLWQILEEKHSSFPIDYVLKWADELLDALSYLHSQQPPVIHRDIKPQNLKLSNENHIILLDFGLAKEYKQANSQITGGLSGYSSIFGFTARYAPLEQIKGIGTDTRSDLYSLGATLYHFALGHAPIDALSRAHAIINGQKDLLTEPIQEKSDLPRNLSNAIFASLALKHADRPASAQEMKQILNGKENTHLPSAVVNFLNEQDLDKKINNALGDFSQPNPTELSLGTMPLDSTYYEPIPDNSILTASSKEILQQHSININSIDNFLAPPYNYQPLKIYLILVEGLFLGLISASILVFSKIFNMEGLGVALWLLLLLSSGAIASFFYSRKVEIPPKPSSGLTIGAIVGVVSGVIQWLAVVFTHYSGILPLYNKNSLGIWLFLFYIICLQILIVPISCLTGLLLLNRKS